MGCMKLGIPKPTELRKKQAVAAAGQSQLIRMYEELMELMDVGFVVLQNGGGGSLV